MASQHATLVAFVSATWLIACGGTTLTDAGDVTEIAAIDSFEVPSDVAMESAVTDTAADAPACVAQSQSDLAGVHIEISSARCDFTLAEASAGITIDYDVVTDAIVTGVVPRAQDAGNCGAPDASGLIVFASVSGVGQHYCLCDTGLCPMPTATPVTLAAGRYHATFMWMGRNWNGPSDTGNPMGAAFPAGEYSLQISAVGTHTVDSTTVPFTVTGTLPIRLRP